MSDNTIDEITKIMQRVKHDRVFRPIGGHPPHCILATAEQIAALKQGINVLDDQANRMTPYAGIPVVEVPTDGTVTDVGDGWTAVYRYGSIYAFGPGVGSPYTGPVCHPGQQFSIEHNGHIYTDYIESVTYRSPEPAIWPELTWRQRLGRRRRLRWITPASWRKPVEPIRPAKAATVTIGTEHDPDAIARATARIERIMTELGIAAADE